MMARVTQIVVDAARPPVVARFWAAVLDGYMVREYDDAELARLAALGLNPDTDVSVILDGPGPEWCFQQVPEPRSGKNRLHVEVEPSDRAAEVRRLCRLGGAVFAEYAGHTTMVDPEGNEFCVTDPS